LLSSLGADEGRVTTAFLAHEVRTALTGIGGSVPILRETSLTSQQRTAVDYIEGAVSHIGELLNLILDTAKLRSGKLEVVSEKTDIEREVESVVKTCAAGARVAGLDLNAYVPSTIPRIRMDRVRLRQILINLVQNAIKFTVKGTVALRVDFTEASDLSFHVTDTGPGMERDAAAGLFDPGRRYQSSALQRERGGTGLGLVLVSSMVEKLRGTITATSTPGQGTTMTLLLPSVTVESQPSIIIKDPSIRVVVYPTPAAVDPMSNTAVLLSVLNDLGVHVERPETSIALVGVNQRGVSTVFLCCPAAEVDGRAQLWLQHCTKDMIVELSHIPVLASVVRALVRPIVLNDSVQAATISCPARTILLAEDDTTSRLLLMRQVSFGDNRCTATTNGLEAVEAYAADPAAFDVVLLDVNMPVLDGPSAAQRIREIEKAHGLRRVRIVALSGNEHEETELLFGDLADICLSKPVRREQLREVLWGSGSSKPFILQI